MGFPNQLPWRDLLEFGEFLIRTGGIHPNHNTFGHLIRLIIPFFTGGILTILTTVNAFQPTISLIDFAGKFEAYSLLGQLFIKIILLLYYREDFTLLLKDCSEFWKIEAFENTPIKQDLEKLMNASMLAFKVLWMLTGLSFIGFVVKPELPIVCYIPNKYYLDFDKTYGLEIIFLIYCGIAIIGYDAVFTGFCTHVILQLKMIQYILENLTYSEYDETKQSIKKCVVHHQNLLSFVRRIKKIYSVLLMGQIGITTCTLSIELCILSESFGEDYTQVYKSLICGLCMFYQFGLYCFPAAEVTAQAENIAEAIYKGKWYEMSAPFRRDILVIMARSQQEISFSPGGVGTITRETSTAVVKTAFSILTMMRTIKEN